MRDPYQVLGVPSPATDEEVNVLQMLFHVIRL